MRRFLQSLFAPSRRDDSEIARIRQMRAGLQPMSDAGLRATAAVTTEICPLFAATVEIASRALGQEMFDVQLRGALALTRGTIAEMLTGEGKTLAAVPAIAWYARQGGGVHVMTANDYLARRDAHWMGPVYRELGLSIAHIEQGMSVAGRRAAYRCDITYATANEIGFDFLRDRIALRLDHQVHRPFAAAVIDEADSILIDEARIPLVIAGGDRDDTAIAFAAAQVVRPFLERLHYTIDERRLNAALTDFGIRTAELAFGCANIYDPQHFRVVTAVQDALHAHALLRRDIDYIVRNGTIEMVDEFKGRVAQDRRWPAGLHTAVEAKEGVAAKRQGIALGSVTLQHLIELYPRVCGMTGTAMTQALELEQVYGLPVEPIPPNRPVIRIDHPDRVFATKLEKERAVLGEIRRAQATKRPVLVGTGSVEESERLSSLLADVPHRVLNARQDEHEAAIIACAGQRGAVTISTNMAGRGTDITLGPGVAGLGGLYVIGTQKHDSRRIDNQLRGRAGRQGDPGESRFFVSLEDDVIVKYGDIDPRVRHDPGAVQRLAEGENLNRRLFLRKYERPVEGQRHRIHERRQQVLEGAIPYASERDRLVALRTIDDLWADYLDRVADLRSNLPWISYGLDTVLGIPGMTLGRRDAEFEFAQHIHRWFSDLEGSMESEIAGRIAAADQEGAPDPGERGAVWTYLTTDQPFGTLTERVMRGLRRKFGATGA